MFKDVVTQENWMTAFEHKKCKACRGSGSCECSICGKHIDDCYCTELPRYYRVCDKCDGEGNIFTLNEKDIH